MDGTNTNLKFFNEYSIKFAETTLHSFINIGTGNLHIVYESLQTVESASGWCFKNIMKSADRILHNSPARGEDYASVTGHQSIRLTSVQQGTICYKQFFFYKFIRFKLHYNFRIKETQPKIITWID